LLFFDSLVLAIGYWLLAISFWPTANS